MEQDLQITSSQVIQVDPKSKEKCLHKKHTQERQGEEKAL